MCILMKCPANAGKRYEFIEVHVINTVWTVSG